LLRLNQVNAGYGEITAIKKVSLCIDKGKIVTILGSNGAGKSSILKCICGLLKTSSGSIELDNAPINNLEVHERVKKGIVYVPEGRRIFPKLTVGENLKIGSYTHQKRTGIKSKMEQVFIYFPRLKERFNQIGGSLSGGEQQMLAIARGLMSEPKWLLLDEPTLGLAPIVIQEIFKIIKSINEEGTTILLVEQNANIALDVAHYGYVLRLGEISMEGTSQDLRNNKEIEKLYLGGLD
jgi:branched-chain amino acid transport system ATP-binding protein